MLRLHSLADNPGGPLQFAHHLERIRPRRAGQHGEIAADRTPLRRIEEAPRHITPDHQGSLAGEKQDRTGNHGIAKRDNTGDESPEDPVTEPPEPAIEDPARHVIPMPFRRMRQRVPHMVRKDDEALEQRSRQDDDHRERQVRQQGAEPPADRRDRIECDDRRYRCRKDGREHPRRGILRRDLRRFPQVPRPKIGVLTHNDRIVDDHSQADDQREQRDHVHREPEGIHHGNCRHHRRRNAGGHPEGGPGVQKEEEEHQNEHQSQRPVFEQDIQAARDGFGACPDQVHGDTFGQFRRHFPGDLLNPPLQPDGVALIRTVDPDRHCGILTHIVGPAPVGAFDQDPSDVPHEKLGSVRKRPKGDRLDFLNRPFCESGAHPGGDPGDLPGRVCFRLLPYRRRDFAQRNVVADEFPLPHLHHRQGGLHAANRGTGDAGSEQPNNELVGVFAEQADRHRAGDDDIGNPVSPHASPYGRLLDILRKPRGRINCGPDIVRSPLHVPSGLELQRDPGIALAGHGRSRLDALDRQQGRLQQLDDRMVNVLCARALPRDGDNDVFDDDVGKELRPNLRIGECSQRDHEKHDEVCGSPMPGEIGDHRRKDGCPPAPLRHLSRPPSTSADQAWRRELRVPSTA